LRHKKQTTYENKSCASNPVSKAKILIFEMLYRKFDGIAKKKGIIFEDSNLCQKKKVFITYISFSILHFLRKGKNQLRTYFSYNYLYVVISAGSIL